MLNASKRKYVWTKRMYRIHAQHKRMDWMISKLYSNSILIHFVWRFFFCLVGKMKRITQFIFSLEEKSFQFFFCWFKVPNRIFTVASGFNLVVDQFWISDLRDMRKKNNCYDSTRKKKNKIKPLNSLTKWPQIMFITKNNPKHKCGSIADNLEVVKRHL